MLIIFCDVCICSHCVIPIGEIANFVTLGVMLENISRIISNVFAHESANLSAGKLVWQGGC